MQKKLIATIYLIILTSDIWAQRGERRFIEHGYDFSIGSIIFGIIVWIVIAMVHNSNEESKKESIKPKDDEDSTTSKQSNSKTPLEISKIPDEELDFLSIGDPKEDCLYRNEQSRRWLLNSLKTIFNANNSLLSGYDNNCNIENYILNNEIGFDELFFLYPPFYRQSRFLRPYYKSEFEVLEKDYLSLANLYYQKVGSIKEHEEIIKATKLYLEKCKLNTGLSKIPTLKEYINGELWSEYVSKGVLSRDKSHQNKELLYNKGEYLHQSNCLNINVEKYFTTFIGYNIGSIYTETKNKAKKVEICDIEFLAAPGFNKKNVLERLSLMQLPDPLGWYDSNDETNREILKFIQTELSITLSPRKTIDITPNFYGENYLFKVEVELSIISRQPIKIFISYKKCAT